MVINFGNKPVENIQFGNTPIKSVYYGSTKIRPIQRQIVIESDLTNSTFASLQAQGWDGIVSTSNRGYRLNSNGLRAADTGSDTYAFLYKDISGYNINSVEFECDLYGYYASRSGGRGFGIRTGLGLLPDSKDIVVGANARFNNNSGRNRQTIDALYKTVKRKDQSLPSGNYTIRGSVSFSTGEIVRGIYQGDTLILEQSYTMTDSERNQAKQDAKYIGYAVGFGTRSSGSNNSLKRVKLTITLSN